MSEATRQIDLDDVDENILRYVALGYADSEIALRVALSKSDVTSIITAMSPMLGRSRTGKALYYVDTILPRCPDLHSRWVQRANEIVRQMLDSGRITLNHLWAAKLLADPKGCSAVYSELGDIMGVSARLYGSYIGEVCAALGHHPNKPHLVAVFRLATVEIPARP